MLKCSRCRHIFPAERTQRASAPEPPRRPASPEGRDLDLAFDESGWDGAPSDLAQPHDDDAFSIGTADETRARRSIPSREPRLLSDVEVNGDDAAQADKTINPPTEPRQPGGQSFSFDEEEEFDGRIDQPPPPLLRDDEPDEPLARDEIAEEDEADNDRYTADEAEENDEDEEEDVRRGRGWSLPLMMFFSVVVAGYFLLARELISDRAFAEEFIARLPMVGSSLAADRLLFRKVALSDIDGSFVRVKQAKEVFVISGSVLNTASRALRNIRIEGTLLDKSGQPMQQETITCGGMDARRLLQGLSLREVEMLGKVEPSRKFQLEPGETTSFAIIFANPPAGAGDFTARVASAQR